MAANWSKIAVKLSNDQKWPFWTITIDSGKIQKNFSKKFRILGVVTDFQIYFLNDSQLFPTFRDLILIEQFKGFNLRRMTVLRSLAIKSYYVITKKLRQNRKFRSRKYFFLDFGNMFWDKFLKCFNLHWRYPGYLNVSEKQCLRHCYPYLQAHVGQFWKAQDFTIQESIGSKPR